MGIGGSDNICLDLEIDGDKISRISTVSMDSPNLGSGEDDVIRLLGGEKTVDGGLDSEVELRGGAEEEVQVTQRLEFTDHG